MHVAFLDLPKTAESDSTSDLTYLASGPPSPSVFVMPGGCHGAVPWGPSHGALRASTDCAGTVVEPRLEVPERKEWGQLVGTAELSG